MAYTDIVEMAQDDDLRRRLYACVASLGKENGVMWVDRWVWLIVATDAAWQTAWAAAPTVVPVVKPDDTVTDTGGSTSAASDEPTEPTEPVAMQPARRGWDSDLVTDQMILDRVSAVWDDKGAI